MLLLWLLVSANQLWLRDCGHLVDAEQLRLELSRVNVDRGELTLTCLQERLFLHFGDEAVPRSQIVGVARKAPEERAAHIVRGMLDERLRLAATAQDLAELVLTPRAGDVALVVRADDAQKRVPLSLLDDVELCRTPCVLHVRPGKLGWVRGGQGTGIRRVRESLTVPVNGGDVQVRAPSGTAFTTGAVITAIGAAMDVIGMVTFILSISTPSSGPGVAVGLATWLSADLLVLPIGIITLIVSRLGKPEVTSH